ncbi:DUF1648 domain-containing protein [Microbacterium nymphoidis]|uniref:DUF1648 domain-containing protein n=1 Tax=Microbacterium nymphoidis TaxID=2898586 RepID=UPI001E5FC3C6|nr:DUF1648 domain-containing protein [Microbacterium nymphoidis]MCD2496844.1 DUF1648 domain-containing protein [Microbacterium nymphoidis]
MTDRQPGEDGTPAAGSGDVALAVEAAMRRYVMVGVVLPTAIALVSGILMLQWLGRLPVPAATHWGFSGVPDGSGPGWPLPVFALVFPIGFALLLWMFVANSARAGAWNYNSRGSAAMALGLSVLLAVVALRSTAVQLDVSDWREAVLTPWDVPAAFGAGLLAGVVGWFLQPALVIRSEADAPAVATPLPENSRTLWTQRARVSRGTAVALFVLLGVTLALAVLIAAAGSAVAWAVLGVMVLATYFVAVATDFRVRVDGTGLTVRALAGWPRVHIPLTQIAAVDVAQVNPLSDFGGWGLRYVPGGRFGVVVRRGGAIAVTRRDGREFVVTVPDAERGAGVLAALADRARDDNDHREEE